MHDSTINIIVLVASDRASCDQGHALQDILDLLVDADFDCHLDDDLSDDDENYIRREEAKTALFKLACEWADKLKSVNLNI